MICDIISSTELILSNLGFLQRARRGDGLQSDNLVLPIGESDEGSDEEMTMTYRHVQLLVDLVLV